MVARIRSPRVANGAQLNDPVRLMPHDIEAEEALLGSLLIDRDALSEVQAEIPNFAAEHFYRDLHKDIYRALLKFGSDEVAISGYLKDRGIPDAIVTVGRLVNLVASSDYVVSAARRVYNKARQRAQIGLAQSILTAGWNGDDSGFIEALEKATHLREDYLPPAARALKYRGLRDIMQTEYPEVRMLVEKLIQQGVVTILAGKAKAGKSFWLLAAAIAIAEACQNAFASKDAEGNIIYAGLRCEQSRVLYMALEDTERRIKNRVKKMRGELLPIPEFIDVATEAPRLDEGVIEQLDLYLDEHPDCKLIIIDTLTSVLPIPGKNGGGYLEDRLNMQGLRDLAHRRDVAILPVLHCRKADGADVFDTIQTTMGTQAGAENLIVLQRRRGEDRAILHATGNDLEGDALAMKWNAATCTWSILGDAEKVAENEQEEVIFGALEALGGSGKLKDIAEILKGEMAFAQVRTLLYRLSATRPNSPVKNKLVNKGGVFSRNDEIIIFENRENIEKHENGEKPEILFENEASQTSHAFHTSQTSQHSQKLFESAETSEPGEKVDALQDQIRHEWERRDWGKVQLAPHIKAGGHMGAALAYLGSVTGLTDLLALRNAVLALGGA